MSMASSIRQFGVAVRVLVLFTAVLGILYPLTMTGVAQVLFPDQANGSVVTVQGKEVGSSLIGQQYGDEWFQTRPSAVDYDGKGSAASQYGPNNPELVNLIAERRQAVAELEGVDPAQVPPDALTASGSGLDPHISPAYAALQVNRVARAQGRPVAEVQRLVQENTDGRTLGFLGEPRVNVVSLNAALAAL
ncbi:potassium-transporting ATPase subunit KdpC [Kribbella sp. CA-247076]|uniref:potassium-transporting ATPase subunit KdpC n=1 Tax=Kribbella sp. CA-247076 TaxID=3239941 RepID=UPI003D93A878